MGVAHSLQHNWLAQQQRKPITSRTTILYCSRVDTCWKHLVGGKCYFEVKAVGDADGVVTVVLVRGAHLHELDGKTAKDVPML